MFIALNQQTQTPVLASEAQKEDGPFVCPEHDCKVEVILALRILSEQGQQQEAAVQSAERTLTLATDRYKFGLDSYLNVITAQTALLSNQRTLVNIRMQQMTASVQLLKALGGGWDASQIPSPKELVAKTPPHPKSVP